MKTLIAGSAEFYNYPFVRDVLDAHPEITEIIPSRRGGVPSLAVRWAKSRRIPVTTFDADTRSTEMAQAVRHCDQMIAVWDGFDRKTRALISAMQEQRKQIYIVSPASVGWGSPQR